MSPLSPEPPERLHAQPRIPGMTSGSGSAAATVAGSAPHNGENKPPQAIVKPQILTHVIEGFVIQEGAEPFPVTYPALQSRGWARWEGARGFGVLGMGRTDGLEPPNPPLLRHPGKG